MRLELPWCLRLVPVVWRKGVGLDRGVGRSKWSHFPKLRTAEWGLWTIPKLLAFES